MKKTLFFSGILCLLLLTSISTSAATTDDSYYSVILYSSPTPVNAGTENATVNAKPGDVITFSHESVSDGVAVKQFTWDFNDSVVDCVTYPTSTSTDVRCTVLGVGKSPVTLNMFPVMPDGSLKEYKSNVITINSQSSNDDSYYSVILYSNPTPVNSGTSGATVNAKLGDIITFSHESVGNGVSVKQFTWDFNDSVVDCVTYPTSTSTDVRCTVLGVGKSPVTLNMFPVMPDGSLKEYKSNTITVIAEQGAVGVPVTSESQNADMPPAGYEDKVLTVFTNNPFPDTNINNWEGKAAAELYRRAVIGGFPDGEFKGERNVNRAEAAKFLLLARGMDVQELTNSGKFLDVLDGQWYVKYIMTAAQKGIINGHPDGSFKPADRVNTAEFLKMLTLTFNLQENLSHAYTDVKSSDWFAKYAGVAQKYNLFPKRSAGPLQPSEYLSRNEVAVAIYQYLSNR